MNRFLLLFLLLPVALRSQVVISGNCSDAGTGRGIPWVHVKVGERYTYTDRNGNFTLNSALSSGTVSFSNMTYDFAEQHFSGSPGDTVVVSLLLRKRTFQLRAVTVRPSSLPDTVVWSKIWMIRDFCFHYDSLLLLTWERSPDKCMLRLTDEQGRESAAIPVKDVPLGFFTDISGTSYLECKEHTYRIDVWRGALFLQEMDEYKYYGSIRPLVGLSPQQLFASTWRYHKPEFAYLHVDRDLLRQDTLMEICDKHLSDLYYSEYDFLSFKNKTEVKRRCRRTGEDQYELAAMMTGFTRSLWWRPLYSPFFMEDTTALIFDHYRDSLFRFDASGRKIHRAYMEFHKPKEYKKKMVQDEINGQLYAIYFKNGISRLLPIHPQTAEAGTPLPLSYRYAEKIKVRNGKVFYLYRPFESSQNMFLYSERLQ